MTKFSNKEKKASRFNKANDYGYETWESKHFCFTDLLHKVKKVTIIIF